MAVTVAQLGKIRDQLFLVQGGNGLALPSNSVDAHGTDDPMVKALDAMMNGLISADLSLPPKYDGLGVGVVNFTKDPSAPTVWLHNGGTPWRIASTGKIAVLLAAVQLRDDVRLVKEVTGLTDPAEYDRLFANQALWLPTSPLGVGVLFRNMDIWGGTKPTTARRHCPRPSSIFDLTKDPIDFRGPEIATATAKIAVAKKLGWKSGDKKLADMTWPQVPKFDFSELLWLMGDNSDNVAATACMSEIGVAYIKSVQRAYGLFQPNTDARLLLADGYDRVPSSSHIHGVSSDLRPLADREVNDVTDALKTKGAADDVDPTNYTDHKSAEPGSATALLAYLIALIQNRFVSSRNTASQDPGAFACETIRQNLSHGPENENGEGFPGTRSYIVEAIASVATVKKQLSKIGLLQETDGEMPPGLSCEFAHLETENGGKKLQYGIVLTGIRHNIEPDLGPKIHNVLLTL